MRAPKIILFLLFCWLTQSANAQVDTDISTIFTSIIKTKRKPIVLPELDTFSVWRIKEELKPNIYIIDLKQMIFEERNTDTLNKVDTLKITIPERVYIDSCLAALLTFQWTKPRLEGIGLSAFTLPGTEKAKKIVPRWRKGTYTLMPPIFIRNNSLCFFFYRYSCGPLCANGSLSIWKKQNKRWVYWWNIYFYSA